MHQKHSLLPVTVFAVGSPRDSKGALLLFSAGFRALCLDLCFSCLCGCFLFFGFCRGRVSAFVGGAVLLRRISLAALRCVSSFSNAGRSTGPTVQRRRLALRRKKRELEKQKATGSSEPTCSASRDPRALHRFARKNR